MVDCEACNGTGLNPQNLHEYCEVCKGSGKVVSKAAEKPKEAPKK